MSKKTACSELEKTVRGRQKTMVDLTENEKRLMDLISSIPGWVWEVDEKNRYTFVSETVEPILGYKPQELIGKTPFELMPQEEAKRIKKAFGVITREKKPVKNLENLNLSKDGKKVYFITNGIPFFDDKGRLKGYRGSDLDITDLKNTEAEISRTRSLLESSVESSKNMMIILLDNQYCYLYFNKAHSKIMSSVNGTVPRIGDCIFDHLRGGAGDISRLREYYDRALAGESYVITEEYGEYPLNQYYEIQFNPIYGRKEEITGITVFARNISERKKIEKDLLESEYRYRSLFNAMGEACSHHEIICDQNGDPVDFRYLAVNPAWEKITGFTSEIVGKTILEIMPDVDPFWIKTYGKVALKGEPAYFDYHFQETGRHFEITAYQPEEKQFVVISKDISDRKRVERSLRESEQKFNVLAKNPNLGLFILQNHKFIYVNDTLAEMHGYRPEEIIGRPYYFLVHPEEKESLELKVKKQTEVEDNSRYEMLRIRKNGESFWAGVTVSGVEYNGEYAVVGSVIDISEQIRIQEALQRSEERYKAIVEETDDFITKIDPKGRFLYANYMVSRIYGLSCNNLVGRSSLDFIHPDDRENINDWFVDMVRNQNEKGTIECRVVGKKGKVYHMYWNCNFHYDRNGKLKNVTSIARNITERRNMEESLKKAHSRLEDRVRERTNELEKANQELTEKTNNLNDLNAALKILLEAREKDREEQEERILINVKELLLPYLNKLKNASLSGNQINYVELIESGLKDIISPFNQKLTSRYMHITPRELEVANLVKEGKSSKEIAEILNSTERTVVAHRINLRKKLGLNKKENLRTYLLSLK